MKPLLTSVEIVSNVRRTSDSPLAGPSVVVPEFEHRTPMPARPWHHHEDPDELMGAVAAEANHESDRRREKQLDAAFGVLNNAATGGR